jgi:hypothetical protein
MWQSSDVMKETMTGGQGVLEKNIENKICQIGTIESAVRAPSLRLPAKHRSVGFRPSTVALASGRAP